MTGVICFRPTGRSRWTRLLRGGFLLGLASLFAYTTLVSAQQTPPKHPLTGRQIASIYTDTAWLDRPQRERAGSGYMTGRLATRVGPTGKVYANDLYDVQTAMLKILQDKVQRQKLTNVEYVQGTPTDARLPPTGIDLALLVDVYHEFWYPQQMLRSIRQALKPNGQLVLLEYRKEDPALPILPEHKMSVVDVRTEVEPEGFTFDRLVSQLPMQHIIVFRKPAQ